MSELKGEIIATGLFGETMYAERHVVTLYDAGGKVVTSCDFAHADEAEVYRKNAEVLAKEIGGTVEVWTKESA